MTNLNLHRRRTHGISQPQVNLSFILGECRGLVLFRLSKRKDPEFGMNILDLIFVNLGIFNPIN